MVESWMDGDGDVVLLCWVCLVLPLFQASRSGFDAGSERWKVMVWLADR